MADVIIILVPQFLAEPPRWGGCCCRSRCSQELDTLDTTSLDFTPRGPSPSSKLLIPRRTESRLPRLQVLMRLFSCVECFELDDRLIAHPSPTAQKEINHTSLSSKPFSMSFFITSAAFDCLINKVLYDSPLLLSSQWFFSVTDIERLRQRFVERALNFSSGP